MARRTARCALLGRPSFFAPVSRIPTLANPLGHSLSLAGGKRVASTTSPEVSSNATPIAKIIDDAAFLLPKQGVLENFVHHNAHENLQNVNFLEALEKIKDANLQMSPGERLFSLVGVDPRQRSNEAVAELSGTFLDLGAAKWEPPHRDSGFLYFFASLEGLGVAPWRRHARQIATRVLTHVNEHPDGSLETLSETILCENLKFFAGDISYPEKWTPTLRALLRDLEGYAGMFERMDQSTQKATQNGLRFLEEAPANTKVRLLDFCAVHSILARSSMEALALQSGWDESEPFSSFLSEAPTTCERNDFHQNPSGLAFIDQNSNARQALESEYEDVLLRALGERDTGVNDVRPKLQLWTCIDEREESFRRHAETATGSPGDVETFGIAGFMGFQLSYDYKSTADTFVASKAKPFTGKESTIMAPEGLSPDNRFTETEDRTDLEKTAWSSHRHRLMARVVRAWECASLSPFGSLVLSTLFPLSAVKFVSTSLFPESNRIATQAFTDTWAPEPQTDFSSNISKDAAARLIAAQLKNMNHVKFAPIVMILGHGSRSVNNPFDAAHNCGACGGREGGPNARIIARFANDKEVRKHLLETHDITIPADTWFVGGNHDTTSELVDLYDTQSCPNSLADQFAEAMDILNIARGRNALERCKRFMLFKGSTPEEALDYVHTRSTDIGEMRPELGHATNASVVVGRRKLSRGRDLSRRAFLPSYDPFVDDNRGTNLEQVITPALIVCSGINMEYYFSTIEGGAGTKLPMNLVGHFGVQQGASGDLLHGLPTQMTEMHPALRALFVVDAPVERLEAVFDRREMLRQIVKNGWVRLVVRDPYTKRRYIESHGEYLPITLDTSVEKSTKTFVPFDHQTHYGQMVAHKESLFTAAAAMAMVASCAVPMYTFGLEAMHPRGDLIAMGGTALSLATLGFCRRYLHGEFMFGRFTLLSTAMLAGFNMLALAPAVDMMLVNAWGLMAYSSVFLIGAYNDRPTARENATYAYGIYKISDLAILSAAAFSTYHLATGEHAALAAAGLITAALTKSSQFPMTNLFQRSMEGAAPISAIAYAGISAHAGVVLLSATTPLWFEFEWARACVASVGAMTAIQSGLVAKIRPDRKGALANATASTLGMIYVILAAGYTDAALLLSFGHAVFRMNQYMRSSNFMLDTRNLEAALGEQMESVMKPTAVSEPVYKLGWMFNRINSDLRLPHLMHIVKNKVDLGRFQLPSKLSKSQQWAMTGSLVVLAGLPFTPVNHIQDHLILELLHTDLYLAGACMSGYVIFATMLIRACFTKVLDPARFHHEESVRAPMTASEARPEPFSPSDSWRLPEGSWTLPDDGEWSDGENKVMDAEVTPWNFPEGSWEVPDELESAFDESYQDDTDERDEQANK